MAARRCSTCGINYDTQVFRCRVCGCDTDYMTSVDPGDWEADCARRLMEQPPAEDKVELWRLEQFLRFGFDVETAESLAVSDADLRFVERLLGQGCPAAVAARIA